MVLVLVGGVGHTVLVHSSCCNVACACRRQLYDRTGSLQDCEEMVQVRGACVENVPTMCCTAWYLAVLELPYTQDTVVETRWILLQHWRVSVPPSQHFMSLHDTNHGCGMLQLLLCCCSNCCCSAAGVRVACRVTTSRTCMLLSGRR